MTDRIITTPYFADAGDLVRWMRYAVKMDCYKVVPATATAIFADGTTRTSPAGKRGGTIAANYSFMIGTLSGKMEHKADNALANEIKERGGVTFAYTIAAPAEA